MTNGPSPNPGGCAIASPRMSTDGDGKQADAEGPDRCRQACRVFDPARDHPARERRAGADPQDGEGRQRDERDGGRNAYVASGEGHTGFYLSGRRR